MALEGDIKDFGVAEIIQLMSSQSKDGSVNLRHGAQKAVLRFENGRVVRASLGSHDEVQWLRRHLEAIGKITPQDMADRIKSYNPLETTFDQWLIREKIVTKEEIAYLKSRMIQAIVLELLTWEQGKYKIFTGTKDPRDFVRPNLSTEFLLMESSRKLDELAKLKTRMPPDNAVLHRTPQAFESADLNDEQIALLKCIDGNRSHAEVIEACGLDRFTAMQTIWSLMEKRLVVTELIPKSPKTTAISPEADKKDTPSLKEKHDDVVSELSDTFKVTETKGFGRMPGEPGAIALDVVTHLNSIFGKIRLYPPNHPAVEKAISEDYEFFTKIIEDVGHLTINATKNRLVINGIPLESGRGLTAIIRNFIDERDIHSITFKKGMTSHQLQQFATLIAESPFKIKKEGGVRKLLEGKELDKVAVDLLEYELVSESRAGSGEWDSLFSMVSVPTDFMKRVREDPQKIADMLVAFSRVYDEKGELGLDKTAARVSEAIHQLEESMEKADPDIDVSDRVRHMAEIILTLDPELRDAVMEKGLEVYDWDLLDKTVAKLMDDEQLIEKLTDRMFSLLQDKKVDKDAIEQGKDKEITRLQELLKDVVIDSDKKATIIPRLLEEFTKKGYTDEDLELFLQQLPDRKKLREKGKEKPSSDSDSLSIEIDSELAALLDEEDELSEEDAAPRSDPQQTKGIRKPVTQKAESDLDNYQQDDQDDLKPKEKVAEEASMTEDITSADDTITMSGSAVRKIIIPEELKRGKKPSEDASKMPLKLENEKKELEEVLNQQDDFKLMEVINEQLSSLKSVSFVKREKARVLTWFLAERLIELNKQDVILYVVNSLIKSSETEWSFKIFSILIDMLTQVGTRLEEADMEDIANKIIDHFANLQKESSQRKIHERKLLTENLGKFNSNLALVAVANALRDTVLTKEALDILTKRGANISKELVEQLKVEDNKEVRLRIIEVLKHAGKATLDHILLAVNDERWFVRRNMAIILGELGDQRAIEPLLDLTRDSHLNVRAEAVNALSKVAPRSHKDSEQRLLEMFEAEIPKMKLEVVKALAKVGADHSAEQLAGHIKRKFFGFGEVSDELKIEIVKTLGIIGSTKAVDGLLEFLKEIFILSISKNQVQLQAIRTLGRIGDPKAIPVLKKISRSVNKTLRIAAKKALKAIEDLDQERSEQDED